MQHFHIVVGLSRDRLQKELKSQSKQNREFSMGQVKKKKLDPTFPTMQLVNDPRLSSVFKFPNFVAFEPTPEITPLPSLWHQQGYF